MSRGFIRETGSDKSSKNRPFSGTVKVSAGTSPDLFKSCLGGFRMRRRTVWEAFPCGEDGPPNLFTARCTFNRAERSALWRGVQKHGTEWKRIQFSEPALNEKEPHALRYAAQQLGVVRNTGEKVAREDSYMCDADDGGDETGASSDPFPFASQMAPQFAEADPQEELREEDAEGTGVRRREYVDRSCAEHQARLLEEDYSRAAAPPRVKCSDCACIMTPEHTSCWCRDCSVSRCKPCSEKHRSSAAGLFHVTDEYDPERGLKFVRRPRAGDEDCTVPGFDCCRSCGADIISDVKTSKVTLISERYGFVRVNMSRTQLCSSLLCGRLYEPWESLLHLYNLQPQTSTCPETFYSSDLLHSMMDPCLIADPWRH